MSRPRLFLKRLFTPVTILMVPHSRTKSISIRVPVLESADLADTGSLDMETLRTQIEASIRSVTEIRTYLAEQRDIYLSTPVGWPVSGSEGKATADGIVSFAGWAENSGILEERPAHRPGRLPGKEVSMSGKGSMTGEIRAPKLAVSEGAVFDGRSRMKGETGLSEAQEGDVMALIPTKGASGSA